MRSLYNHIFQRLWTQFEQKRLSGHKIFSSPWHKLFTDVARSQGRIIDIDALRHIFTFDLIDRYVLENIKVNNVCVIGDGMTNFVSPSLRSKLFKKVISVNLVEVLLNDLFLLEKEESLKEHEVGIAITKEELLRLLADSETHLILVPAFKAPMLFNQGIELFVNIASFQEMTNETIANYFQIIKSNNSYFYCCNREYKKLYGGEILEFMQYPWGNPRVIIDEYCPWHQTYYDKKYPFFFQYDGAIMHRLVKYNDCETTN